MNAKNAEKYAANTADARKKKKKFIWLKHKYNW